MQLPIILDGAALAREREPLLRARADAVAARRGTQPRLLILAFGDGGVAPHVRGKLRAAEAAGVEATPLVLPTGTSTEDALAALSSATHAHDAVFLQVPFPAHIDGDALAAAIPLHADADVMSPPAVERFLSDPTSLPPVTFSALLALLQRYDLDLRGLRGVLVADASTYSEMLRITLLRAGMTMLQLIDPDSPTMSADLAGARVVVVAAARPGVVDAEDVTPGAIVIDVGYYNAGGRGDVETSGGVVHLHALAPVPGGIGPMTVSCLIERTILLAERR